MCALMAVAFAVGACGVGPSVPTEPTRPPVSPGGLTYEHAGDLRANVVQLTWTPVTGARDYLVEIGSTPGGIEVAQAVAPEASYAWVGAPLGRLFFVRVRGRNSAGVSAPSAEALVLTVDLRDAIEALFLGSGPLVRFGVPVCVRNGHWVAFPPGTTVRVRVSSSVPAEPQRALQIAVEQISEATLGQVSGVFELTAEEDPRPRSNEVTVAMHPNPQSEGCSGRACVFVTVRDSAILSARALVGPADPLFPDSGGVYAHEAVGHGMLGMCHIDEHLIGGGRHSVMAGDGPRALSGLDLSAARAVYGAGLSRGATRREFLEAGLVNPSSPSTQGSVRGDSVRTVRLNDREEVVVIDN